ncbi:MAG: hypothetical protein K5989_02430 [Lachnospiraceae bacterium]|nr:hypothetical protein [Lachnospiraceae bacterium]
MSKIYLEAMVPGNAKKYEFMADSRMTAGLVKAQFIEQVEAIEKIKLFEDRNKVLMACLDLNGLLQDTDILGEVGVKSGSRMMLI